MSINPTTSLQGAAQLNGGLLYENYIKGVQQFIEYMDPVAALFESAGPGEFTMTGEKLVYAGRLAQASGAVATNGWLPDPQWKGVVRFEATPARVYARVALDHYWKGRGSGDGSFEDYGASVLDQGWEAFERTTGRHINGGSTGTVGVVASTSAADKIIIKNGYGVTDVDPLMYIEPGAVLAWHDASNSFAVGGAGVVSAVNATTRELTFTASIRNGSGTPTPVDGDPVVFCTTSDLSAQNFVTERGNAPLGMVDLFDPLAANASYLGVTEATNPRVKPMRMQSADFGEVEVMKFLKKLQTKSQSPVNASTHVLTCQEGVTMALARTLVPYTQIQTKGGALPGGWDKITIGSGLPDFVESSYHWHNVLNAFAVGEARVIDLDGRPDIYAGDGSEWSRLLDYDGSELFMKHYVQRLFVRRNRFGSLHTIAIDDNAYDFSASVTGI